MAASAKVHSPEPPRLPDPVVTRFPGGAAADEPPPRHRRFRWLWLLLPALVAGSVTAGALLHPDLAHTALRAAHLQDTPLGRHLAALTQPSAIPVPAATAALPLPVVGLGRLQPEGEVIHVAAPSGLGEFRLERLFVTEGDRVAAGQRLAALDNEGKLRAALQQARADVAQRQASLSRMRLVVQTEREQRKAAVARAEAEVENGKIELERAEVLQPKGATSVSVLDQRRLAFRQASERLAEARAAAVRYGGPLAEQPDLLLAQQELAAAEAAVARAEVEYAQAFIAAPLSGRILKIHYRVGERIGSKGLLDMGATDRMMVKAEVYESDVGRLAAGQAAQVTATPLQGVLTGKVERVGLQVQQQSVVDAQPAANTDARVVETWIRLDPVSSEQASGLTGLQVRVRVQP